MTNAVRDTPAKPDALWRKSYDVPVEWEQRLREISPISDRHSWLAFRWFAEAQRWILYECVPIRFVVDNELIADLGGPDAETPAGADVLVSVFQQQMFKKHRVHARPMWVIQGSRGGHYVVFSATVQEDHRALGLPPEPPKVGDLPYAAFDERVVRQLVEASKLVQFKNDFGEFKKRFGDVDSQKREAKTALHAARERYVTFINNQFEDGDDLFRSAYGKGELSDAPTTDKEYVRENEKADEKYVLTGRF
jgi:hypothetical protein